MVRSGTRGTRGSRGSRGGTRGGTRGGAPPAPTPSTPPGESFEAALAAVDNEEDPSLSAMVPLIPASAAGPLLPTGLSEPTYVLAPTSVYLYSFPTLCDKQGNVIKTFNGTNAHPPKASPGTKLTLNPVKERIKRWQETQLALGNVTPSEIKGTAITADIAFFFKESALPGTNEEVVGTLIPTVTCIVCE